MNLIEELTKLVAAARAGRNPVANITQLVAISSYGSEISALQLGIDDAEELLRLLAAAPLKHGWQIVDQNDTHVKWRASNGAELGIPRGQRFAGHNPVNLIDLRCTLGTRGWTGSSPRRNSNKRRLRAESQRSPTGRSRRAPKL